VDLVEAARDVRQFFVSCELARARTAREWGRSPVELSALVHIGLTDGVTPHAIASRLSLTTGSVTALLDRLQNANLVERLANPDDRRSLLIVNTPEGARLADRFMTVLEDVVGEAFGEFDADSVTNTLDGIRRITEALEERGAFPL
jgi:DNA-binding MarR family transcriptional regulator